MKTQPVKASTVEAKKGGTIYPAPFSALVKGRVKRKLGDIFELSNFGVNLTHLDPGAISSLFHAHKTQDEFIYLLSGQCLLKVGNEEHQMQSGDCIGFKAGTGTAHQLINQSNELVAYLEIGDRSLHDDVEYPNDDIQAKTAEDGSWLITHKDGRPY